MPVVFALATMNVNVEVVDDEAQLVITQTYTNVSGAPADGEFIIMLAPESDVADLTVFAGDAPLHTGPVQETHGGLARRKIEDLPAGTPIEVQVAIRQPVIRNGRLNEVVLPLNHSPRFLYSKNFGPPAKISARVAGKRDRVSFLHTSEPGVVLRVDKADTSWTTNLDGESDVYLGWLNHDIPTLADRLLAKLPSPAPNPWAWPAG